MLKGLSLVLLIMSWGNNTYAYSFSENEINIVKEAVNRLCENTAGTQIEISASGKNKSVLIKELTEIDFGGIAEFSEIQWAKVESLLPSASMSTRTTKCVTELTPLFMDVFSKKYEEETDVDM